MNKKLTLEYFRDKGLLPFQANFALEFLESKESRQWFLLSPVGTGKTHLVATLIAHILEDTPKKRLLILAPASLLMQWQSQLSDTSAADAAIIVDRKTFLELESRVPVGENPWPDSSVILMSLDLAKRDDMITKLSNVDWDLVIFDESHLLVGKRRTLCESLMQSEKVHRTLLLSAVPLPSSANFPNTLVKKIVKFSDVVNWEGRPLFYAFETKITTVSYERTKEEYAFLCDLQEFAKHLSDKFSHGKFIETIIFRAASSSVFATEGIFRRLLDGWRHIRNKIAHGITVTAEDTESLQRQLSMFIDEPEVMEDFPDSLMIQPEKLLFLYQKLELLLDQIEVLPTDSKMDALISYMKHNLKDNKTYYICILSAFPETVQYLSSSLQDIGKPIYALTSAIELSERRNRFGAFRVNGGILISTDNALEGVPLEYANKCINYDLPINVNVFDQRQGRFLRLGRKEDFKMVVLRDMTKALPWEEELLKKLKINFP